MSRPKPYVPFTFAEIVVGAPWATSLLASPPDNDKARLLHRNNGGDEWSTGASPLDATELEREARRLRAAAVGDLVARAVRHLRAVFRRPQRQKPVALA